MRPNFWNIDLLSLQHVQALFQSTFLRNLKTTRTSSNQATKALTAHWIHSGGPAKHQLFPPKSSTHKFGTTHQSLKPLGTPWTTWKTASLTLPLSWAKTSILIDLRASTSLPLRTSPLLTKFQLRSLAWVWIVIIFLNKTLTNIETLFWPLSQFIKKCRNSIE